MGINCQLSLIVHHRHGANRRSPEPKNEETPVDKLEEIVGMCDNGFIPLIPSVRVGGSIII